MVWWPEGSQESECWKKNADSEKAESTHADGERRQRLPYTKGLGRPRTGPTFVIKDKANHMEMSTSKPNEVWYVDFGASNHMASHE